MFNGKLLNGVKVVELATFIAAPSSCRALADMGAEVIKVEAPSGDNLRYTARNEGRPEGHLENTTFDLENANKKSITLNLKSPAAMEVLMKLLAEADVFVTNIRGKALDRLGLDYETLKEKFPVLVYGTVSGYGEKGPDSDLPGYDYTAFFARGGLLGTMYEKGSVPMHVIPGLGDHQVGMYLAAGICAALYRAKMSGKGEKVSVSLFHAAIFSMGLMIQAAQYGQPAATYPLHRRDLSNPLQIAHKTKDDRYIQIAMPPYDMFYNKFITIIGRPDLVDHPVYSTQKTLGEKACEVHDILAEQFLTKTAAEWIENFTKEDIPFALAQTWDEILIDKQAWAADCLYEMDYPTGNKRTMVRSPIMYQEAGLPRYDRAPYLGENTTEILQKLGYSKDMINNLIETKDITVWEK